MCEGKVYDVSIFVNKIWLCKRSVVHLSSHPSTSVKKTDLETQIPCRIFRQMKNKVMKAVLNVLEGLAMGIFVATIVGTVSFVVMFTFLHVLEALGI